jgi:predicted DsbA family dithiol-disulfide isomerase
MFYKRDILSKLEQELTAKEVTVVTGMRQVGKTTILKHIFEKIESDNKVLLDLENPLNRKIFEEQNQLGQGTVQFTIDDLKKWAGDIGLDQVKFNTCLDSGKNNNEVQKDFNDGSKYGVSGTPGFFIGNDKEGFKPIVGAQPYQVFEQAINEILNK